MTFDDAFLRLLGHEGGFVNDPADKGGATRYGVTEAVARAHGYKGRMQDLPLDTAKGIYRKAYWGGIDDLPDAVRYDVFDATVNSGSGNAVRWLQAAAGVAADGQLGPMTLAAVRNAEPGALAARFNGHRLAFMTDLSNWPNFGRGWARRLAANLKAA